MNWITDDELEHLTKMVKWLNKHKGDNTLGLEINVRDQNGDELGNIAIRNNFYAFVPTMVDR